MCRRLQAPSVVGLSVTLSRTSGIVNTHKCQNYTYVHYLSYVLCGVRTEDEENAGDPYMKSEHEQYLVFSEITFSADGNFDTKTQKIS